MPLLVFIVFVYIEITLSAAFIHAIGSLGTFIWLFGSFFFGLNLLRVQGPASMLRAAREMQMGKQAGNSLLDGLFKSVAAILFIIPGIVSDVVGLLCLVPLLRQWLLKRWLGGMLAKGNIHAQMYTQGDFQSPPFGEGNVYDHEGSSRGETVDVEAQPLDAEAQLLEAEAQPLEGEAQSLEHRPQNDENHNKSSH